MMAESRNGARDRIGRLHPAVIVGTAAAVAVVLVGALLLTRSSTTASPGPRTSPTQPLVVTQSPLPPNPARDWMDAALTDFNPLKGVIIAFETTAKEWRAGRATDAQEASNLGRAVPAFLQTRALLQKRAALGGAPRALDDYRLSVTLYVQAARTALAATKVPAGALHDQLALSYARLQLLADRVFDQAAVELAPLLPPPVEVDGVVVTKQAEVPAWTSLGVAAGPPLAAAQPTTAVRSYVAQRPEQAVNDWVRTVAQLGAPSAGALRDGIAGGSPTALRAIADDYQKASDRLYAAPDPRGERAVSTRVQLGLLADSEAARVAEAAGLAPSAAQQVLTTTAEALALVGDQLWDARLGARSTGFPNSLLTS
jgi:hypothetical protein